MTDPAETTTCTADGSTPARCAIAAAISAVTLSVNEETSPCSSRLKMTWLRDGGKGGGDGRGGGGEGEGEGEGEGGGAMGDGWYGGTGADGGWATKSCP